MPLTTDDVARMTKPLPDDKAFIETRRRRRRKTPSLPDVPGGPCCRHCRHWRDEGEAYGECRLLAVLTRRAAMRQDDIIVIAASEAMRGGRPWVCLRTAPGYAGCLGYQEETDGGGA